MAGGLLADKVALVTGGAAGIGEAIAKEFARQGARVAIVDRDAGGARAVAAEIGGDSLAIMADVRDGAAVASAFASAFDRYGRIDILVNNAGAYPRKAFLEMTEADWDEMQAVNLKSVFHCCKLALPGMVERGGGKIVNISSVTFFLGMERLAHYVAAKGGIIGMTRVLAREMGPHGIHVNCITPGAIQTESERTVVTEEQANAVIPLQCLKRRLQPADIANTCVFLASYLSDGVTGQTLNVDGGWIHY